MMPDIEYDTLEAAIQNAPDRPQASLWEEILCGGAGDRLAEVKRVIAQGLASRVEIEILASPDTLQSAGLQGRGDLDGARIVEGATSTFDCVRFKFCRQGHN
jgi:hypothetical protein